MDNLPMLFASFCAGALSTFVVVLAIAGYSSLIVSGHVDDQDGTQ